MKTGFQHIGKYIQCLLGVLPAVSCEVIVQFDGKDDKHDLRYLLRGFAVHRPLAVALADNVCQDRAQISHHDTYVLLMQKSALLQLKKIIGFLAQKLQN